MNTTPSFEDIPEGHVILCYEGRTEPRKYMITTDSNGQVYYRVYFAEEIDFTADALPHDSKGILVSHVNEAFASYLEMTPVQVEQCGKGIALTYALPIDKCKVDTANLGEIYSDRQASNGVGAIDKLNHDWFASKSLNNYGTLKHHIQQGKDKCLRALQPEPIDRLLQQCMAVYPSRHQASIFEKFQHYLSAHPDFWRSLADDLSKAGTDAEKVNFSGVGATGLFLTAGNVVIAVRGNALSISSNNELKRQPIPQHLQSLASYERDGLHVEITPALTVATDVQVAKDLATSIANTPTGSDSTFWKFDDVEARNVGTSPQGTAYVLDGNAVELWKKEDYTYSSPPNLADRQEPTDWLMSDGTWKQYEEFKSLHEAFNSPLHQAGGRFGAEAGKNKNTPPETLPEPTKQPSEADKPSQIGAIVALFAGAAATIAGLLNLKKRKPDEKQDKNASQETEKTSFNVGAAILTTVGAFATGWAVYSLVSPSADRQRSR